MSAPLPELPKLPYSRNLLNEVRLGRGVGLKQLRDTLTANPRLHQSFVRERKTELENARQREAMMWVKDASSRVKRVDTEFRDRCTFTDPLLSGETPNRALARKCAAKTAFDKASSASTPQSFLV